MRIGTNVINDYQGMIRYGKVSSIFKGEDGWTWCEVDWIDDEEYQKSIEWRNFLSDHKKDHNRLFYRVDELKQFNLNKTIQTLLKMQSK